MTKSFDYLTIQLFLYLTNNLFAFEMAFFYQIAVISDHISKASTTEYKPNDKSWQTIMQTF